MPGKRLTCLREAAAVQCNPMAGVRFPPVRQLAR